LPEESLPPAGDKLARRLPAKALRTVVAEKLSERGFSTINSPLAFKTVPVAKNRQNRVRLSHPLHHRRRFLQV